MSKTYMYLLVLFAIYLLVVKGVKTSVHTSSNGVTHGGGGKKF